MTDPIIALTATEIVKLAFNEFIKSSAGETAKHLTGAALSKANELRKKILDQFKNDQNSEAEKAIASVQGNGSLEASRRLATYLETEMIARPDFAQSLQRLVQQIYNIQSQNNIDLNQQNNNYGRDQNIINSPQGNIRVGGS